MRPTRCATVIEILKQFILSFFDQNPLSSMSILVCRDGVCKRISEMSGSAKNHLIMVERIYESGEFSLQNGLELAHATLRTVPKHGSKEIVVLMASLTTCDQGDIFETIEKLAKEKICTSVVELCAEVYVAKAASTKTGGSHGVAKHGNHLRQLVMEHIKPPAFVAENVNELRCSFVRMGFPSQAGQSDASEGASSARQTLCAGYPPKLTTTAFHCPRCVSIVEELPSTCPVCGLELIAGFHLARSAHHLFPVPQFKNVTLSQVLETGSSCFSCNAAFRDDKKLSSYFICPQCSHCFCDTCDTFVHESLHICPGCTQKIEPR